jgi:hypothetical protein
MLAKPAPTGYPDILTETKIGVMHETKDITPSISEDHLSWSGIDWLIGGWLPPHRRSLPGD